MNIKLPRIRNLFKNPKLKAAFAAVKFDMDNLEEDHNALKGSTNEWIMFLDQENRLLKLRLRALESKLENVEAVVDEDKLSVLRSM